MAIEAARLSVVVTGDTKDAEQGLKRVETAGEQAASGLRKLDTTATTTGSSLTTAGKQAGGFSDTLSRIGPLATVGMAAGGAAVAKFGMDSFNSFAAFEKQMNEVFSLMPGISQQAMGDMTDQVKDFSREFGVLPKEVVPALYEALSSGIPADNVFSFMETAQKAATGGVTELKTAVDGITSVVNAYGAETVSAAQASDIMFTAVKVGKTTFDQLSTSLYNVNPIAAALGVSFGDVAASLAAMTAVGIPTAVATTQLRQLFVELSDSGSKLAATFTTLSGKSFKDFIAGGGTLQGALQLLEQHAGSTNVGINDLFGSVEAGSAALALTGKGTEIFTKSLDEMANSSGATDAAFTQMQQGVSDDIDRMKANFATFQIDVGEKLTGAALAIMDANLGQKLKDTIQPGLDFWNGLGPMMLDGIRNGLGAGGDLVDKGRELIDGLLSGAKQAWDGGVTFFQELPGKAVEAVGDLAATLTDAGTALLTGLWDGAKTVWTTVDGWLGGRGGDAAGAVGDLGGTLISHGSALLTGLWDGATGVWGSVSGWLGARGSDAAAAVGSLAGTLLSHGRDLLTGLWDGAKGGWDTVNGWLGGIGGLAVSAVGNLGGVLFSAGASLVQGLINGVTSKLGDLKDKLAEVTNLIPGWKGPPDKDAMLLYESGQLIMDGLIGGVESRERALQKALHGVGSAVVRTMQRDLGPQMATAGARAGAAAADRLAGSRFGLVTGASGGAAAPFAGMAGAPAASAMGEVGAAATRLPSQMSIPELDTMFEEDFKTKWAAFEKAAAEYAANTAFFSAFTALRTGKGSADDLAAAASAGTPYIAKYWPALQKKIAAMAEDSKHSQNITDKWLKAAGLAASPLAAHQQGAGAAFSEYVKAMEDAGMFSQLSNGLSVRGTRQAFAALTPLDLPAPVPPQPPVRQRAGGMIPSYMFGTDAHPGGLAFVHRKELLNLPGGTQVLNRPTTRALLDTAAAMRNGPMAGAPTEQPAQRPVNVTIQFSGNTFLSDGQMRDFAQRAFPAIEQQLNRALRRAF